MNVIRENIYHSFNRFLFEKFDNTILDDAMDTGITCYQFAEEAIAGTTNRVYELTEASYQSAKQIYHLSTEILKNREKLNQLDDNVIFALEMIGPSALQCYSLHQTNKHLFNGLHDLKNLATNKNSFKDKIKLLTNIAGETINVGGWGALTALTTAILYDKTYASTKAAAYSYVSPIYLQERAIVMTSAITILNMTLPTLIANPLRGALSGFAFYNILQLMTDSSNSEAFLITSLVIAVSNVALPAIFSKISSMRNSKMEATSSTPTIENSVATPSFVNDSEAFIFVPD